MYNNFNDPLGFEQFEPQPEANQDAANLIMKDAFDKCVLVNKVFSTKEGKKLLEELKKQTLEASTWKPSPNHDWAVATGFAREGQNALVRFLVKSQEAAQTSKNPEECYQLLQKWGVL